MSLRNRQPLSHSSVSVPIYLFCNLQALAAARSKPRRPHSIVMLKQHWRPCGSKQPQQCKLVEKHVLPNLQGGHGSAGRDAGGDGTCESQAIRSTADSNGREIVCSLVDVRCTTWFCNLDPAGLTANAGGASSFTSSRQEYSYTGSQECGETLASSKPLLLHRHDTAKACNLLACTQMAWNQLKWQ